MEKEEENTQLKDLIERMEAKNNSLCEEITKNMKEYQESKDGIQNNLTQQYERNSSLLQKIGAMKTEIEKLREKSLYFKYLFQ